jgi:hypothetical protein
VGIGREKYRKRIFCGSAGKMLEKNLLREITLRNEVSGLKNGECFSID